MLHHCIFYLEVQVISIPQLEISVKMATEQIISEKQAIGDDKRGNDSSSLDSDTNPEGISEKALLRKLDWKLLPGLTLLYLLSFLDRSNGMFGLDFCASFSGLLSRMNNAGRRSLESWRHGERGQTNF